MIYSKNRKYKPWYGALSKVISRSGMCQISGYIFEIKNIEEFLIETKAKNYNVDNILEEVLSENQKIK